MGIIFTEFFIHMKLEILTEKCLNENYSRVWVDKHLFVVFSIRNCLKNGDAYAPLILKFTIQYAFRRFQVKNDSFTILLYISAFDVCCDFNILYGRLYIIKKI